MLGKPEYIIGDIVRIVSPSVTHNNKIGRITEITIVHDLIGQVEKYQYTVITEFEESLYFKNQYLESIIPVYECLQNWLTNEKF